MLGIKGGLLGGRGNSQTSFSFFLSVVLFHSFFNSSFFSVCSFFFLPLNSTSVCSLVVLCCFYFCFLLFSVPCLSSSVCLQRVYASPPLLAIKKNSYVEPNPFVLGMTVDVKPLSSPRMIRVFLILITIVFSFPVNRHIRVYWCCKMLPLCCLPTEAKMESACEIYKTRPRPLRKKKSTNR